MTKRTITGIPSGDLECWCLLVDKETFLAVRGVEPQNKHMVHAGEHEWESCGDVGHFAQPGSPYQYAIYPSDIFEDAGFPSKWGDPAKEPPITFIIETGVSK